MIGSARKRRAGRALERQLENQRRKAENLRGHEAELIASMLKHTARVRQKLEAVRPVGNDSRVLEVGSGAHGLIFFFEAEERVGIDPLADQYRALFPAWQERAKTIAGFGEQLPFDDDTFDIVLSNNVVDHAENPRRIIEEIARVLKPDGLFYFTVNVHHPIYSWAASVHAIWRAIGIPVEVRPFADHTVHLTPGAARQLFEGLPLRIITQTDNIGDLKTRGLRGRPRHMADHLKKWFFKNACWEAIAIADKRRCD